eukprot:TRINITY_DN8966_c0_g1_i1.p1 TRINITY_DN8966_c0_g1~~TRINITY_DN8966_c0_g1_i1.p1  ORF type:complete len:650 (+),score=82.71 TRINITY_DN8966_c0_g1_i1:73-2022(+)
MPSEDDEGVGSDIHAHAQCSWSFDQSLLQLPPERPQMPSEDDEGVGSDIHDVFVQPSTSCKFLDSHLRTEYANEDHQKLHSMMTLMLNTILERLGDQDHILMGLESARLCSTSLYRHDHPRGNERRSPSNDRTAKRKHLFKSKSKSMGKTKNLADISGPVLNGTHISESSSPSVKRKNTRTDTGQHDKALYLQAVKRASEASLATSASADVGTTPLWCVYLNKLVKHRYFEHAFLLIILANVVLVGVEVDARASLPESRVPGYFDTLNAIFISLYTLELVLKIAACGLRAYFITSGDLLWNYFDLAVVLSSIIEIIAEQVVIGIDAEDSTGGIVSAVHWRMIRVVRISRAVRSIRAVRIVRFVRSLRTILISIFGAVKNLFWTMLLLVIYFYIFAVGFTTTTTDICIDNASHHTGSDDVMPHCDDAFLRLYWSSLPRSMFTLFGSLTGGVSWFEPVLALLDASSGLAVAFFIMYICIGYFAVLNVVTGLFCQNAIETAALDKDMAVMEQMSITQAAVKKAHELFAEIDEDASGYITVHEFEQKLKDESMVAYLASFDINVQDAWTLFKLVDIDMSGCIDLDEFVTGCMSLRGPATAIQIAKVNYDNKMSRKTLEESVCFMYASLDALLTHFDVDIPQVAANGDDDTDLV